MVCDIFQSSYESIYDNFAPREHSNTAGSNLMQGFKIQLTNRLRITLDETISVS